MYHYVKVLYNINERGVFMFQDNFGVNHIYGKDLLKHQEQNNSIIIDIRQAFELKICKLPNTLDIPMMILLRNPDSFLSKDKQYFILCHTGQRSYHTCQELQEQGYKVINIIGGIASIDEYNVPY
jgi:rhodanese-related sulfurtransferase